MYFCSYILPIYLILDELHSLNFPLSTSETMNAA